MSAYLMNAWYAVAFTDEVKEAPFARKCLGMPLVVFRRSAGDVAVLVDRCPHRFAPLSRGVVVGDEIQCGYHGLRFGATGACLHNPHSPGGGPLPAASVRAFAAMEKYGIVWFWPGDATRAEPQALPEVAFFQEPERYSLVKGYLHVEGNYQLVVDNLLDLSHASYLHPDFAIKGVSAEQALANTTQKLERRERSIVNYRLRSNLPSPTPNKVLFGFGDDTLVHTKSHMTWHPPAMLDFDAGSWEMGTVERDGIMIPQLHFITPETEFTSHYFFINGRNRRLGDPEIDRALLQMFDNAFRRQDEPMIAAVQRSMGNVSDIDDLKPVLLKTDTAPVAARRILTRLIAEERDATAVSGV